MQPHGPLLSPLTLSGIMGALPTESPSLSGRMGYYLPTGRHIAGSMGAEVSDTQFAPYTLRDHGHDGATITPISIGIMGTCSPAD